MSVTNLVLSLVVWLLLEAVALAGPPKVVSPPKTTKLVNEKAEALVQYNLGADAAQRSDWTVASAHLEKSLSLSPSQEARTALGWVLEQQGQELLARGDAAAATDKLERALRLQSKISNNLALLASSYAALFRTRDSADQDSDYYRHYTGVYGLNLKDYSGQVGLLAGQEPARPAQDNYLNSVLISTNTGDRLVTRLSRLPITLYIKAAPEPRFAEAVWDAARSWETLTDGTVEFARVDEPTRADILISFVDIDRGREAGHAAFAPVIYQARSAYNRLSAVPIELNFRLILGFRPEDQTRWIQMVAAHEIGHAIGLWGHSDNTGDLMYPSIQGHQQPSPRDIQTLIKLFSYPPSVTRP